MLFLYLSSKNQKNQKFLQQLGLKQFGVRFFKYSQHSFRKYESRHQKQIWQLLQKIKNLEKTKKETSTQSPKTKKSQEMSEVEFQIHVYKTEISNLMRKDLELFGANQLDIHYRNHEVDAPTQTSDNYKIAIPFVSRNKLEETISGNRMFTAVAYCQYQENVCKLYKRRIRKVAEFLGKYNRFKFYYFDLSMNDHEHLGEGEFPVLRIYHRDKEVRFESRDIQSDSIIRQLRRVVEQMLIKEDL